MERRLETRVQRKCAESGVYECTRKLVTVMMWNPGEACEWHGSQDARSDTEA
jgi:hypothetical protein